MKFDPITTMIRISGEPAQIVLPEPKAYDPDDVADWTPNAPTPVDIVGVYSEVYDEPPVRAKLLVSASAIPDNLKPREAKVLIRGETYVVLLPRRRYWRGQVTGYSLDLGA